MKPTFWAKYKVDLLLVTTVALTLLGLMGGCTRYNPYTGRYDPDPGKTMVAVGSAALAGSVIYHEIDRHKYHRPRNHYHYHYHKPPRHRRPGHPPRHRR
jgi:hypothetical protein